MKRLTKALLFGCGGLAVLAIAAVVLLVVWIFSGPTSGVKLGNEMDEYALEYLDEHGLLNPGEEILAYYDATLSMDGSEAAILTTDRVIYHKNEHTTSIAIEDIVDIQHSYESFTGDVIVIQAASDRVMKIEIAPMNLGETFMDVLTTRWERSKPADSED